MNSFMPSIVSETEQLRRPVCSARNLPKVASISDDEFRLTLRQDSYQRVFVELNTAFYEDYGRQLDEDSKAGLLRFLKHSPMRAQPVIGAESSGRLIATWRIAGEALSLEFIEKFKLKFAVTATEDGQLQRRWGIGHPVTLFEIEPLTARFAVA